MRLAEGLNFKRVISHFPVTPVKAPLRPFASAASLLKPQDVIKAPHRRRRVRAVSPTTVSADALSIAPNALSTSKSELHPLLNDPSIPLSDLLDHYNLTSPIPSSHLSLLLGHRSTPHDIITVMPSVIAYVEDPDTLMISTVELLQALLVHLGKHQMLALLPSVVQLFLQKMENQWDTSAKVNVRGLQARYKGFIQALRHFSTRGPSRPTQALPLPVRTQVIRIMSHLLKILKSLPSPSDPDKQQHLSKPFIKFLIHRRWLTPELRRMLVYHADKTEIELSPFHWQQCTLSAIEQGNDHAVRKYRRRWKHANAHIHKHKHVPLPGILLGTNIQHQEEEGVDQDSDENIVTPDRSKEISRLISGMVLSRYNQSMDESLTNLEPYLTPSTLEATYGIPNHQINSDMRGTSFEAERYDSTSLLRYAWSILLSRVAKEKEVTADALIEMADSLPGDAIVGHTLTPIMHGLIKRGEPLKAWEIWLDLIEKEKSSSTSSKGLFIDRVTLAVATEVCHQATDLDTAVILVDTWAKKPSMRIHENHEEHMAAGSVPLDAQNINILLNLCRLDGRPSIAFRLWAAAEPRYGVFLDDISLSLLLDIARYSNDDFEGEVNLSRSDESAFFRRRLKAIAREFSLRRGHDPENDEDVENESNNGNDLITYNKAIWANSPTNVLLDNPENAWRIRDAKGVELPWIKARRIFRQVIFGNWLHLKEVESPLEIAHQGAFHTLVSFFTSDNSYENIEESKIINEEIKIPSPNARYQHIIPTSNTFKSYIALLGYYNKHTEIPLVLAWMKELNIKPSWSTMCLALLHISEFEGPRRWVKGFGENGNGMLVRDEEIIRKWLIDWLSDKDEKDGKGGKRKIVPTEQDVADSRRWLAEKRQRLTA